MGDILLYIFGCLFLCFPIVFMCRSISSFFDEAKCQWYIPIRNKVLQKILISNYTKGKKVNIKNVSDKNVHKLSLLGFVAYIVLFPLMLASTYTLIFNYELFSDIFKWQCNMISVFFILHLVNSWQV